MKKTLLLIAFSISVIGFSGCTLPGQTSDSLQEQQVAQDEVQKEIQGEIEMAVQEESTQSGEAQELQKEFAFTAEEDGQTAFSILEKNLELEYKDYDFGVFIEGINGLKANKDYYWAFYVNDEYAEKGSNQTILKKDDIVIMKYEKVQAYEAQ